LRYTAPDLNLRSLPSLTHCPIWCFLPYSRCPRRNCVSGRG